MLKSGLRFIWLYVLMICACGVLFSAPTFAYGNSGHDGGISGSSVDCAKRNGKYTPEHGANHCYGGSWVYYEIPAAPAKTDSYGNVTAAWTAWYNQYHNITIDTYYAFTGGTITGCEEVGGYYRLAPFQYKDGGTPEYQVGLTPTSYYKKGGGYYPYNRHGFPGSESWNSVERKFKKALEDPNFKHDGTDWSNTSWFCQAKDPHKDHEGELHSWSEVKVSTTEYDDLYGISEDDGYVGVTFSTNDATVDVYFGHTLWYDVTDDEGFKDSESAKFTASYKVTGGGASELSDSWTADGTDYWDKEINMNSSSEPKEKITVSLNPGETKTVCRKISDYYTNMTFEWNGSKYTVDREDKEDSEACATITRPKEPGPPNEGPTPVFVSGGTKSGIMFAGEKSSIGWNAQAQGSNTRRLAAFDTISYLVNPSYTKSDSNYIGGNKNYQGNDLCAFISSQIGANKSYCGTSKSTSERSTSWTTDTKPTSATYYVSSHDGTGKSSIVVPEAYEGSAASIGAKYCTTLGYKFQYWSAVNYTSYAKIDENQWTHDSSLDYWYIFDSACSVIAKRPQMAVWNGSVFSTGGIQTAESERYTTTAMETLVSNGGATTTYGSWAEYLAIANGELTGLSSGAGLAIGAAGKTVSKDDLSSLTIANDKETLGKANIEPNGAYKERLVKYLKDKATEKSDTVLGATPFSGTNIVKYTGNLTINGNITSSQTSVSHQLKDLPQMVIFVDGNLDISQNVTRIDAWLIVGGNINTCAEFVSGTTEANGVCNQQLKFNGPVMAKSLSLNRTFGAENGNTRSEPAEVFNLRPDAYIWAYNQASGTDDDGYDYKIVYNQELAPRY